MAYDPHTGSYYSEGLPAGYDAWRTRSPYEDEPEPEPELEPEPEPCWHDEFDERGFCMECRKSAVTIAIEHERLLQVTLATQRWMARQHRWRHLIAIRRWLLSSTLDFRLRLMAQIWRVKWARRWTRRFDLMMCDEEIPF